MFHNVLWAVDPTAPSGPPVALLRALDGEADSHLQATAVLEPFDHLYAAPPAWIDPGLAKWRQHCHSALRKRIRDLLHPIAGHGIRVDYVVAEGYAASVLLADVRRTHRDLVLLRTQSYDGKDGNKIGSLVEELLRRSPVPVCCVRDVNEDYTIRRVLIASDLSDSSLSAFEAGVTIAEERGASVTLVHLLRGWDPSLPSDVSDRLHASAKAALKAWRERQPHMVSLRVPVEEEVLRAANAADGILERARELSTDLIVIASHGWTGIGGVLFGSTARRVVRGADVPVLVTRTPDSAFTGGAS
ncbi:MAG: universal stress protein [Thermoanaerobaculia bacterium]